MIINIAILKNRDTDLYFQWNFLDAGMSMGTPFFPIETFQ